MVHFRFLLPVQIFKWILRIRKYRVFFLGSKPRSFFVIQTWVFPQADKLVVCVEVEGELWLSKEMSKNKRPCISIVNKLRPINYGFLGPNGCPLSTADFFQFPSGKPNIGLLIKLTSVIIYSNYKGECGP